MWNEFGCTICRRGTTHCFNTSSGTQTNSYFPSQGAAANTAGRIMNRSLLPTLESESTQGLTPLEQSYYGGQIQKGVAENTASAQQGFTDQTARQGNMAGRGAVTEGQADIARGGVQGTAQGLSNLQGMNINQQQTNLNNLLRAMGIAYSPSPTGGSSTSSGSLLSTLSSII